MVKYMQSSKQRRDFIDVTKFALSILIVVIHISPIESLNPILRPFLRTAVPLFFLISAYLFFKKYGEAETIEKKIARIERYVKRNLQLYFFWLIVLLIPTLSYKRRPPLRPFLGPSFLSVRKHIHRLLVHYGKHYCHIDHRGCLKIPWK